MIISLKHLDNRQEILLGQWYYLFSLSLLFSGRICTIKRPGGFKIYNDTVHRLVFRDVVEILDESDETWWGDGPLGFGVGVELESLHVLVVYLVA